MFAEQLIMHDALSCQELNCLAVIENTPWLLFPAAGKGKVSNGKLLCLIVSTRMTLFIVEPSVVGKYKSETCSISSQRVVYVY
jgi:hypothetical protein